MVELTSQTDRQASYHEIASLAFVLGINECGHMQVRGSKQVLFVASNEMIPSPHLCRFFFPPVHLSAGAITQIMTIFTNNVRPTYAQNIYETLLV